MDSLTFSPSYTRKLPEPQKQGLSSAKPGKETETAFEAFDFFIKDQLIARSPPRPRLYTWENKNSEKTEPLLTPSQYHTCFYHNPTKACIPDSYPTLPDSFKKSYNKIWQKASFEAFKKAILESLFNSPNTDAEMSELRQIAQADGAAFDGWKSRLDKFARKHKECCENQENIFKKLFSEETYDQKKRKLLEIYDENQILEEKKLINLLTGYIKKSNKGNTNEIINDMKLWIQYQRQKESNLVDMKRIIHSEKLTKILFTEIGKKASSNTAKLVLEQKKHSYLRFSQMFELYSSFIKDLEYLISKVKPEHREELRSSVIDILKNSYKKPELTDSSSSQFRRDRTIQGNEPLTKECQQQRDLFSKTTRWLFPDCPKAIDFDDSHRFPGSFLFSIKPNLYLAESLFLKLSKGDSSKLQRLLFSAEGWKAKGSSSYIQSLEQLEKDCSDPLQFQAYGLEFLIGYYLRVFSETELIPQIVNYVDTFSESKIKPSSHEPGYPGEKVGVFYHYLFSSKLVSLLEKRKIYDSKEIARTFEDYLKNSKKVCRERIDDILKEKRTSTGQLLELGMTIQFLHSIEHSQQLYQLPSEKEYSITLEDFAEIEEWSKKVAC